MILPFELDPQIIHHIIYSQAGSIGKAIIELLMNSVDASATTVRFTITKDGFHCEDDGKGFASREDVLRYFGRFGTPHEEGDATYGRFRLGRGQIMAHASTVWQSNNWKMTVDTRDMGYNYDLDDIDIAVPGCTITGRWYEPLTDTEHMSAVQEVRDLVRYTPVNVELNGRMITRDPKAEKWDYEDEFACYRAKEDGSLAIYNQGVLVRHDPAHIWGVGGLIVSKQPIGLNVSRTEILRKTCPVWKAIAKQFGKMAEEMSSRLGDHRKTEARREKSARALLSGDANMLDLYTKEEVITVLPGKRHITLNEFLHKTFVVGNGKSTIVEDGFDVPKGEAIAREKIMLIVHPQTLQRFGCYNTEDFRENLDRIVQCLRERIETSEHNECSWHYKHTRTPEFVAFSVIRDAFIERTSIVSEKVLDKETRRAWVALRWCIQQYAGVCTGKDTYGNGRLHWNHPVMQILLGESNNADAWTDGESYIAINRMIVERLKNEPLETAAYIFGLTEHEVAHEGDSIECGHDEAFYQRHHDISIKMSSKRQRYIHMWLMKLTTSMEAEGKKASGVAWRERYLVDKAGNGRQKRGLPRIIEDVSQDPIVIAKVPEENMAFIDNVNFGLISAGVCPPSPNWVEVIEKAKKAQSEISLEISEEKRQYLAEQQAIDEMILQEMEDAKQYREHYATVLGIEPSAISDNELNHLYQMTHGSDAEIIQTWEEMHEPSYPEMVESCRGEFATALGINPNEISFDELEYLFRSSTTGRYEVDITQVWQTLQNQHAEENVVEDELSSDMSLYLDDDTRPLVQAGETKWSLERNASAAGFYSVKEYLKWRSVS